MPRQYHLLARAPQEDVQAEIFHSLRENYLPRLLDRHSSTYRPMDILPDSVAETIPSYLWNRVRMANHQNYRDMSSPDRAMAILSHHLARPLFLVEVRESTWTASRSRVKEFLRPFGKVFTRNPSPWSDTSETTFDDWWKHTGQYAGNWEASRISPASFWPNSSGMLGIRSFSWGTYRWEDPPFAHIRATHTLEV